MPWLRRFWFRLREPRNRLWVRPAVASIGAVLLALAAAVAPRWIAAGSVPDIERDTLDGLLTVVASSMLAVTTFSLSIMVSAFASASSSVTPRATELVMDDEGTRSAIAMFLSAFIYAVVALVALGMRIYDSTGRFVLFLGTVTVLVLLLLTLIEWVRTLASLGRLSNTLDKIEDAASGALRHHWRAALMGAQPAPPGTPPGRPVYADHVAYVRHLGVAALQALAEDQRLIVHVRVRPGVLIGPGTELARLVSEDAEDAGATHEELDRRVRDAFYTGAARNFEQDPRFGLIVLSESAQRALSPAVNDPGTAIDVMNRLTRALIETQQVAGARPEPDAEAPRHARVTLVPLDEAALVFDGFDPIARDGAGTLEIALRMQRLLAMVASGSRSGRVAAAAREMAARAWTRAERALPVPAEVDAVRAEHQRLFG